MTSGVPAATTGGGLAATGINSTSNMSNAGNEVAVKVAVRVSLALVNSANTELRPCLF